MSTKAEMRVQRAAELKKTISTLARELENVEGKRGICSRCGEEGPYANWGVAHDGLICIKCWNENEIAEARKKYGHLIGLRVMDLIIEPDYKPLQGIKLEGGYILEVEREHDGDVYLDVEQKPSKTKLVTIGVPQHQIADQRWPKQYMENIGKNLLRACHAALKTGTEVVIVRLEKPLEEAGEVLKKE